MGKCIPEREEEEMGAENLFQENNWELKPRR